MSVHELARVDSAHRDRPAGQAPAAPALSSPAPALSSPAPASPAPAPIPPALATARRSASGAGDPLGGTPATPELVDTLRRRRGSGSPLPPQVARQFGEQLGADLSGVRVHADAEADRISRSVQASAFTHGNDVYFTQGTYAPGSERGQHLLAHELAHVVQARSGHAAPGASGPVIGRADDPAEAAADATATRVLSALRRRANHDDEDMQ
jgi:hypothetical protein